MPKIRVLVVDDSVVIRRMLSDCLNADPAIEVIGIAADGQIALAKVEQLNPDIITLDLEMPVLDGLGTLRALRKTHPRLPVIMFSTLTERGAETTLEALAAGANDYVTKPANVGSVSASLQRIAEDLVPRIKALCARNPAFTSPASTLPPPKPLDLCSVAQAGIDVLAIGVSTGGPNALATLLPRLISPFPVPVVIVQHMPPLFTKMLADRISAVSGFHAREGEHGAPLKAGDLWVAPGGSHMEVEKVPGLITLRLHTGPPVNSCRPAVDLLFQSVAAVFGWRSLAVILTGMGQDGLVGCQYIRESGGQVLAQDEASSVVWGMPGAVAQAGLADKILSLDDLSAEINQRASASSPFRAAVPIGQSPLAIAS